MPAYTGLFRAPAPAFSKAYLHLSATATTLPGHVQTLHNRPGVGRHTTRLPLRNSQFRNAFQTIAAPASHGLQESIFEKSGSTYAGLSQYFDALKEKETAGENVENNWQQFQFQKCIEWKNEEQVTKDESRPAPSVDVLSSDPTRLTTVRAYSSSAVDELRRSEEIAEAAAIADVDAAIAEEIKSTQADTLQVDAVQAHAIQTEAAEEGKILSRAPSPPIAPTRSPVFTPQPLSEQSPDSAASSLSKPADAQAQSYAEHLTKLSVTSRYAEIPPVFEAMLVGGIRPTATAYNALLDAAIHVPAERIQVVPKALDIYSDMLHRKVWPNTQTYDKLLHILASRSLEVTALRRALEVKRQRFGGMEQAGKFMLASSELEFDILSEDERLTFAVELFMSAAKLQKIDAYSPETYLKLIEACSEAGRITDMARVYRHMTSRKVVPSAPTFSSLIGGFTKSGDLRRAVECYNVYKSLVVSKKLDLTDRQDAAMYASVIRAYIESDKIDGAMKFYHKILKEHGSVSTDLIDLVVTKGFVQAFLGRGSHAEALDWAQSLKHNTKAIALEDITTMAADQSDSVTANAAFASFPIDHPNIVIPATAMLALHIRGGDVSSARKYWQILSSAETPVGANFIEPTAMYAVALIGSGQVAEGLAAAHEMFSRIRASGADPSGILADQVDEGELFVQHFMATRGISEPQFSNPEMLYAQSSFSPAPFTPVPTFEDTFDPYASSTDFKGSSLIADELERGGNGRANGSRLNEALGRFKNMRRAGRHPRYIAYAKLISAAARDDRITLVHDILGMARSDIPMLPQYKVVRYGWASILDAMVGACLTLGNRALAAQYHQELLDMGTAPTANTFGLYITTLKEATKTFDEASEAVKIFHRSKAEGVQPSSFLYNALIGKLGKARRIDDCLFYFAEMRALGIRPTSVTYGTLINALCRVSDEKFAVELFEEMESMPNYKARPAPYNSLMQFFLTTKRDKTKVLALFERMQKSGIQPTNHTYKLLVDTYATLEPVNMTAAEAVLDMIRCTGQKPEAVHYSSLIHAKGCVAHDMAGAKQVFDSVLADKSISTQACLYQALFESMVANHRVADSESLLVDMALRHVQMTPYIANTLIHGWANEKNIAKSEAIYASVGHEKREPSTYESMTRAYLAVEDRNAAKGVVSEMLSRGYPAAVSSKILELVGGGSNQEAQQPVLQASL